MGIPSVVRPTALAAAKNAAFSVLIFILQEDNHWYAMSLSEAGIVLNCIMENFDC